MFERFTEPARNMIVVAQNQARDLIHADVGTEHLLAALTLDDGLAGQALAQQGVTIDRVRGQILEIVGLGLTAPGGHIPFTPRARRVIEAALQVSIELGHHHVGPEHLLLALIADTESVACRAVVRVGSTPDRVREQIGKALLASQPGATVFEGYTAADTDGPYDVNPLRATEDEAAADATGDQKVRRVRFALERGEYFIAADGGGLPIEAAGQHLDYNRARKAAYDRGGFVYIQVPMISPVRVQAADGSEVVLAETIVWKPVDVGTRIVLT
jgi:hypothetical protein